MPQDLPSNGNGRGNSNQGSPFPGCLIFSTIVLIFGGLIVLYTTVGMTQNRQIGTFTQDKPATIPKLHPTPDQVAAAKSKLLAIKAAVSQNRADRVLFTAEDLNTLIASMEIAKDFRGQTFIKKIGESGILAEMAQPVRKGIFSKGYRYLNGDFLFIPQLRTRTIAFRVVDIRPATGAIPEAFIGGFAGIDFFKLDPKNEFLAAHIHSLKRIYTEDGSLVVETKIIEGEETQLKE